MGQPKLYPQPSLISIAQTSPSAHRLYLLDQVRLQEALQRPGTDDIVIMTKTMRNQQTWPGEFSEMALEPCHQETEDNGPPSWQLLQWSVSSEHGEQVNKDRTHDLNCNYVSNKWGEYCITPKTSLLPEEETNRVEDLLREKEDTCLYH
ncbi:hypothetical protein ElyMa_001943900 [Elysia marginata]|uniref:Uncharacterized protein n=1 Tax=Elysia marginata TaxID=1093978 RepID=A0AAV4EWZ6_9GAST|nr:hypothetical protein ElyMa_001943900 [Elysia marginata]